MGSGGGDGDGDHRDRSGVEHRAGGGSSGRARARARAQGDPDYRPLLDRARAIADGVDDLQYLALVACERAEVAWLEGRLDAIASETDAAYALASERGERSFTGELGVWRARAELAVDPQAETFELHRLELDGHSEEAARLWAEKGCRYQAALALADADDAAALRRALGVLQGLGARPAAAIVTRRLRQLGERRLRTGPRQQTLENPAGLTGRQLEVLALLAQGMRNADIAQRLVVSQRTVDHHVSAILSKLGTRTRGEAAAEAARLGLTAP